jgi:hypothetical protein
VEQAGSSSSAWASYSHDLVSSEATNSARRASGDPAQLADLDAAKLADSHEVEDLVAADVQHVGDLLDSVCLHVITSSDRGLVAGRLLSVVTVGSGS